MAPKTESKPERSTGPRELLPLGSPEWCRRTIDRLQLCWLGVDDDSTRFEAVLKELADGRAYDHYPPEKPYRSMDALTKASIGRTLDEVGDRLRNIKLRLQPPGPNLADAGRQGGRGHKKADSDRYRLSGHRDETYWLGRLKTQAPEHAEAYMRGEFTSMAAACIAAGIRKPDGRVCVRPFPEAIASMVLDKCTASQVRELIRILQRESEA